MVVSDNIDDWLLEVVGCIEPIAGPLPTLTFTGPSDLWKERLHFKRRRSIPWRRFREWICDAWSKHALPLWPLNLTDLQRVCMCLAAVRLRSRFASCVCLCQVRSWTTNVNSKWTCTCPTPWVAVCVCVCWVASWTSVNSEWIGMSNAQRHSMIWSTEFSPLVHSDTCQDGNFTKLLRNGLQTGPE